MNAPAPVSGPHAHVSASVSRVMVTVMVALTPATLFGFYAFGWPALTLFLITIAAALAAEWLSLMIAGKPTRTFLADGSAVLTGWLLAMTLPPWAPWWIGVVGALFAIVIGKHVFGGLGQNVLNPAMLARVALLVSFPVQMTLFVEPQPLFAASSPGILEGLAVTFAGAADFDAISSATVLGHVKTELGQGHALETILAGTDQPMTSAIGMVSGSMGETSAILILLGGLYLLWRRVISWQIPVAMLATIAALAGVLHLVDPARYADPLYHLTTGAVMLGAFFIATDYVTSPAGTAGRLVFGAGCGALVYVIRTWGGFPEGVGFAVLLMNAATPLLDFYLRPRVYGRRRDGSPLEPTGRAQE